MSYINPALFKIRTGALLTTILISCWYRLQKSFRYTLIRLLILANLLSELTTVNMWENFRRMHCPRGTEFVFIIYLSHWFWWTWFKRVCMLLWKRQYQSCNLCRCLFTFPYSLSHELSGVIGWLLFCFQWQFHFNSRQGMGNRNQYLMISERR